jgi:hypothetical protein
MATSSLPSAHDLPRADPRRELATLTASLARARTPADVWEALVHVTAWASRPWELVAAHAAVLDRSLVVACVAGCTDILTPALRNAAWTPARWQDLVDCLQSVLMHRVGGSTERAASIRATLSAGLVAEKLAYTPAFRDALLTLMADHDGLRQFAIYTEAFQVAFLQRVLEDPATTPVDVARLARTLYPPELFRNVSFAGAASMMCAWADRILGDARLTVSQLRALLPLPTPATRVVSDGPVSAVCYAIMRRADARGDTVLRRRVARWVAVSPKSVRETIERIVAEDEGALVAIASEWALAIPEAHLTSELASFTSHAGDLTRWHRGILAAGLRSPVRHIREQAILAAGAAPSPAPDPASVAVRPSRHGR